MKINTILKKVLTLFLLLWALTTTVYGQSVAIQSEPAIETCYGTPYTATAVVEGATVTKYFWYSGEELLDSTTTNTFTTCNIYVPTRITVKIVTSTNDTIEAQMETINLKDTLIITVTDPALLAQTGLSNDTLGDFYTKYAPAAFKAGTGALKCLMGVVSALVTLIFFVFFLMTKDRRGSEVVREMAFLKEETRGFVAQQIDLFIDIVVSFFQRQVIICLIEGVLYGLGFMVVGLPYGFVIGFLLGALNLVPLLGTVTCLPIALPIAYFGDGGSVLRLALVIAVWLSGQILDGYLITPKIQGEKTGLGYAGVIFSFFFWGVVFHSMLGLLLAIPLSAFCVVFWRALKGTYIKGVI